jgi:NAD(P) transhydrogenase subunit beta
VLLTHLAYLVAASLFIVGLHYLRTPATAPRGNLLAALGMLLAVVVTLLESAILRYDLIIAGLLIGTGIGGAAARLVQMTAMPQMVGLFNGFGGGASMLVATAAYVRLTGTAELLTANAMLLIGLGTVVGGITFTGSLMAFGKLQDLLPGRQITFPLQHLVHVLVLLALLAAGGTLLVAPHQMAVFLVLLGLALLFGVLFVLPIGAADMPVVISLLNACSGLAASLTGFVVRNNLLIIAGALVGASGLILTQIMCRAMNRSLANVLLGEFGELGPGTAAGAGDAGARTTHSIDSEEGAMVLAYAQQVVIVPGYGMAVAQAQHAVRELAELLEHRGVVVKYAIHPVAGRMPGHMNVLLAEANVPYSALYDMDDINPEFEHTDVVLVIGANDIVNPAARSDTASPIYGMPILDVDRARHVIVVKRSLNPGFAGIDNALFYHHKTMMLFGDARQVVTSLINEVKRL